ncbi:MAG: hypothetical protein VX278_01075, partial [Myxococcota bacterium]|nr:hypothetical protein [Myxococcota bacterium]
AADWDGLKQSVPTPLQATVVEAYARAHYREENEEAAVDTQATPEEGTEVSNNPNWFKASQLRSWLEDADDTWYCAQLAASLVLDEPQYIERALQSIKKQPFFQTQATIGEHVLCHPTLFEQAVLHLSNTPTEDADRTSDSSIIGSLYLYAAHGRIGQHQIKKAQTILKDLELYSMSIEEMETRQTELTEREAIYALSAIEAQSMLEEFAMKKSEALSPRDVLRKQILTEKISSKKKTQLSKGQKREQKQLQLQLANPRPKIVLSKEEDIQRLYLRSLTREMAADVAGMEKYARKSLEIDKGIASSTMGKASLLKKQKSDSIWLLHKESSNLRLPPQLQQEYDDLCSIAQRFSGNAFKIKLNNQEFSYGKWDRSK